MPARESRRTSSSDVFSKELDDERRERRKRRRKAEETQGRSDTPDLVDKIMNIKMMTSNAPLVSTPAGHHSVKKSMEPISSYVGAPRRRESDDPHNSNDGNDPDEKDEGRRSRDHDRSRRRKRSRSRSRDTESRRNKPNGLFCLRVSNRHRNKIFTPRQGVFQSKILTLPGIQDK